MRKIMNALATWSRRLLAFAVGLSPALALQAEQLVVDRAGASITGAAAEYTGMTLHGDYTIGAGAAVTNLSSTSGTRLSVGPDAGDDVTMTVKDGGQFVGSGDGQKSANAIVIGENGGKGKIIVSDIAEHPEDPKRNKPSWNYNNYTFGAMAWNFMLAAGASTASDTMDILRIDTNAFFSVWCVSNRNTQVKARILFNGGTYYMHHRVTNPLFCSVPGSETILEGVNGNDVNILRMAGSMATLGGYNNGKSGILRFRGDNDVVFKGTEGSVNTPGVRLTDLCVFEQKGDIVAQGCMQLRIDGVFAFPYGPNTGNVVLQDPDTLLDFSGRARQLNGLLGCGSVVNSSTTASAQIILENAADKLASEMVSADLKWQDSAAAMGLEVVKRGAGMMLADAMPAAPKLTIEAGGLRTTEDSTPETMKGQTVEFKEGTTLDVAAGVYTAVNTILPPTVPVTIAAGAAFRAQAGDASLASPTVANGGAVEKTGSGTLTIYDGATAYAGTIRAQGGTVKLSGLGNTNDFWRFTIMQGCTTATKTDPYIHALADIVLLDANGALAYTSNKMKDTTYGKAAKDLAAGEVTVPEGTTITCSNTAMEKTPLKYLFDGNGLGSNDGRWSNLSFPNKVAVLDDESSWFPITFRLSAGHAAVYSFIQKHGWGGTEYTPQAWRLESSPDGITWHTVSERLGGPTISYASDGSVGGIDSTLCYDDNASIGLADTAVLRADAGATIDLGNVAAGNAPCGGLEVDHAKGGGTISRFEPVVNGTLKIENYEGVLKGGYEIPLTFGTVLNPENIKTWKLVVNGNVVDKKLMFKDGKIVVAKRGMLIIVH